MKCRQCDKDALSVVLGKTADGKDKIFTYAFCKETCHAIFDAYDNAEYDSNGVLIQPKLVHVPSGDILRLEQMPSFC